MGCNGESMECTECVNNGIKCWCVCMQNKGGVKSEKGTRKKSEKMEKRGKEDKQGRQDALASQHALTSAFISAEHPLTRGRSPWHTAFTNAVCVWQWMTKNKSQVKTQTNHTHSAFGLCLVCVSERKTNGSTNHKKCQRSQKSHRQDDQSRLEQP